MVCICCLYLLNVVVALCLTSTIGFWTILTVATLLFSAYIPSIAITDNPVASRVSSSHSASFLASKQSSILPDLSECTSKLGAEHNTNYESNVDDYVNVDDEIDVMIMQPIKQRS